jgi:glycosyltransferase involved in cell wall biosynthesis
MTKLSVVMAVYNGAAQLAATLDSVLAQSERDFELIAIDDGSTDATPDILRHYAARDARIAVITQENAGLTRSLIRGCDAARADVIARHDCGDLSHPERFRRQLAVLDGDPETVLVSCAVRFRAAAGELLYDVHADGDTIREGLLHGDALTVRSLPGHGSAMFRREAYRRAGGYRQSFRYAQDLDLWLRLAPLGRIVILDDVLYEASVDVGTLSATARTHQVELTGLAVLLRDSDPAGHDALLTRAAAITRSEPRTRRDDARTLYFIASCLRRNRDRAWRRYARAALRHDPLHLRTWLLFVRGLVRR